MTDERFNLMASTAMELAAEMEWSDFPLLPGDGPRESARWIMVEASGDLEFIETVRAILGETFPKLEAVVDHLEEFEPAEIMAANIVQRAAREMVAVRIGIQQVMVTKFRRWDAPVKWEEPGGGVNQG